MLLQGDVIVFKLCRVLRRARHTQALSHRSQGGVCSKQVARAAVSSWASRVAMSLKRLSLAWGSGLCRVLVPLNPNPPSTWRRGCKLPLVPSGDVAARLRLPSQRISHERPRNPAHQGLAPEVLGAYGAYLLRRSSSLGQLVLAREAYGGLCIHGRYPRRLSASAARAAVPPPSYPFSALHQHIGAQPVRASHMPNPLRGTLASLARSRGNQ